MKLNLGLAIEVGCVENKEKNSVGWVQIHAIQLIYDKFVKSFSKEELSKHECVGLVYTF